MTTIFFMLGIFGSTLIFLNDVRRPLQDDEEQHGLVLHHGTNGAPTSSAGRQSDVAVVSQKEKDGGLENLERGGEILELVLEHDKQEDEQGEEEEPVEPTAQVSLLSKADTDEQNKYFIFHFGPPKTASTTIQFEMSATRETYLKPKDGYYIIGKGGDRWCKLNDAINNGSCNLEVKKYMQNTTTKEQQRGTPAELLILPECWNDMINGIEEMKDKGSLLFSSESLNLPIWEWSTSHEWYTAFNDALSKRGFKLIVVGVYRRLYQWLPSVHNQHTKHYIGGYSWEKHNRPLIPLIFQSKYVKYASGTGKRLWFEWITPYLDEVPDHIETRILNLHTELDRTVGTKFFCDIIPNAPATCQHMLDVQNGHFDNGDADDEDEHSRQRRQLIEADVNEGGSVDEDGKDEDDKSDEVRNKSVESGELYQDFLSVAAADAGYIDKDRFDRPDVNAAIGEYQMNVLKRGPHEFPIYCANINQLTSLLNASLYWEQKLFPAMVENEAEHRDAFWTAVNENKYCAIDTRATLEMDEWKSFFVDNFQARESIEEDSVVATNIEQEGEGDSLEKDDIDLKVQEENQKYFILHIGPPKAASTTIQYEMGVVKERYLEPTDRYYIVGRYGDQSCKLNVALKNKGCIREMNGYKVNSTPEQQADAPTHPECWNNMIDGIAELNDKPNLIISSESINIPWSTSYDWYTAFDDALSRQGYKLIVVCVYRRLYQWLPSVYNQHTKYMLGSDWKRHNPPLVPLIFDSEYVKYAEDGGRPIWFHWIPTYLEEFPDHIETKILNLHTELDRTVGTKFFCDMIPNAPATCLYMLDVQNGIADNGGEDAGRRKMMRILAETDNLDDDVNDGEYSDNEDVGDGVDDEDRVVRNKSVDSARLWHDTLTRAAADAGYIDVEKFQRRKVNDAVEQYQTVTLQRNPGDFPLSCASVDELNTLIDASVYWEQKLFPTMIDAEDEHRQTFWGDVDENKYCTINVTATLEMDEWKDFFIESFQH